MDARMLILNGVKMKMNKIIFTIFIGLLLVSSVSAAPPDDNDDGCISLGEISSYVSSWLQGIVTLSQASNGVSLWLAGCTSPNGTTYIIADHYAVAGFNDIPPCWINKTRQMFFVYPGESHGVGIQSGMQLIENSNSMYAFAQASNPLTTALPANSFVISRYIDGSNWNGENMIWTTDVAITNINSYLQQLKDLGRAPDAFGWGWCWDMTNGGNVGGAIDPVYNVRWAGRSVGSITGSNRWGIDANDQVLTGNAVSLQTYLDAFKTIQTTHPDIAIIYQTGPVDEPENLGESGYQRHLKHEAIRNWVISGQGKYLFDYADILSYNNEGILQTTSWTDPITNISHVFPIIHPDNDPDYEAHISQAGVTRIAKANWWLMARISGWDGTPTDTCTN
jgi:hypothetical protein